MIVQRGKEYFAKLDNELVKQICMRLEDAPRDLGVEATATLAKMTALPSLNSASSKIAKYVISAKDETNRIEGKLDQIYVAVPVFKYDQDTRVAAAKMLGEKNGSFKGWSDDAKGDLNGQLKKAVENALGIDHFKDFKVSLLSRPLRDWYQQQQEILQMLPPSPPNPVLRRRRRCPQNRAPRSLTVIRNPELRFRWRNHSGDVRQNWHIHRALTKAYGSQT